MCVTIESYFKAQYFFKSPVSAWPPLCAFAERYHSTLVQKCRGTVLEIIVIFIK